MHIRGWGNLYAQMRFTIKGSFTFIFKQTRTLQISENIKFTNDDVMKYASGPLQWKLPRAPLPFNPALVVEWPNGCSACTYRKVQCGQVVECKIYDKRCLVRARTQRGGCKGSIAPHQIYRGVDMTLDFIENHRQKLNCTFLRKDAKNWIMLTISQKRFFVSLDELAVFMESDMK